MARLPVRDITLEYVLKYKGSRWKRVLDDELITDSFVDSLRSFLNDIPECRRVRAYVLMGDRVDSLAFDTSKPILDTLYELYVKVADNIDAISIDTADYELNTKLNAATSKILELENPEISTIKDRIEETEYAIDRKTTAIGDLMNNLQPLSDDLAVLDIRLEELERRLDLVDLGLVKTDMKEVYDKMCDAMISRGFQPILSYDYQYSLEVVFIAQPRLMYDSNIQTRTPISTMPIAFKLSYCAKTNKADIRTHKKMRAVGGYSATHPHVGSYICYGSNLTKEVSRAQATGDYVALLDVIDRLLRSYNSGSQFITWASVVKNLNVTAWSKFKRDAYFDAVAGFLRGIIQDSNHADVACDLTPEILLGPEIAAGLAKNKPEDYQRWTEKLAFVTTEIEDDESAE